MQKWMWFFGGLLSGLTALSITRASVPSLQKRITDDTAIYQRLSEIRVKKEPKIDFDADIERLARLEGKYQEKLPTLKKRTSVKKTKQQAIKRRMAVRQENVQSVLSRTTSKKSLKQHFQAKGVQR